MPVEETANMRTYTRHKTQPIKQSAKQLQLLVISSYTLTPAPRLITDLMLSAIAQQKGNTTDFIDDKYWPLLKIWADYLVSTTFDPADQLCTDDFMGRSAHNSNLAIKGIIALGAYAQLMEYLLRGVYMQSKRLNLHLFWGLFVHTCYPEQVQGRRRLRDKVPQILRSHICCPD